MAGWKADLVGEYAREQIYDQSMAKLDNQILILGKQWQRIKRLAESGAHAAICDSPLLQNTLYLEGKPYKDEMTALVNRLDTIYPQFNIVIKRVKPYVKFGRYQEEEQAQEMDSKVLNLLPSNYVVTNGDREGMRWAALKVQQILRLENLTL